MNHCKNLLLTGLASLTFAQLSAQEYPNTPPEESPMPMKPEMTEIWEPEVEVVTPGEKLGDAPSDAIILFGGENLEQWVSQSDSTKAAPWEVKDGYFQVSPGTGGIQTKMKFGDCQIHLEWSAPDDAAHRGQGRGNSGLFFRIATNCRFWTHMKTELMPTDRLEVFTRITHRWSTPCVPLINGIPMT